VQESFSGQLSAVSSQQAADQAVKLSEGLSFGLLDCPHYTRPAEFRGWTVPEVLLSGNHEGIRRWRRKLALAKTLRNRPDLLAEAALSEDDRALLEEIKG